MATVEQHLPGVWLITCPLHGYLGAAIHMAHDLAEQIRDTHNHQHHLEEERTP